MNRRDMLKFAAAIGLPAFFAPIASAQPPIARIRRHVLDPLAKPDIDAFATAVALMLAKNDATDSDSWMYWANVHGTTPGPIPLNLSNIWGSCDHGEYFLAWHRMYIGFFESVIARLSNRPNFALPYWDWFTSLALPSPFTVPADANNPLWRPDRNYRERYSVSTGVLTNPLSLAFNGFNRLSFGDPHSNIHLNFLGEMNKPSTAARDPLFWLHHVAMDRLWEIWAMSAGRQMANPGSPWADRKFAFTTSSQGAMIVRDILATSALGYTYDSLTVATKESTLPGRPLAQSTGRTSVPLESTSPNTDKPLSLAEIRRIQLDNSGRTLTFDLPPSAASTLESIGSRSTGGTSLYLVIEGVEILPAAIEEGFLYDIYINLPKTSPIEASTIPSQRHYIGQINSFGMHQISQHALHMLTAIPLDAVLGQLRLSGAWSPNQVEIHFIDPARTPDPQPRVLVNSVRIELRRQ